MHMHQGERTRLWVGLVCATLLVAGLLNAGSTPKFVARAQTFLGTAQAFAVLGGSTVTNTGPSVISGDLGVWPGLAIVGFPPGIVLGTQHPGTAVAMQAQSDVTTAYNTLAGLPCDTNLTGQDLAGLTLTPGVYCFNTSALHSGGLALTLDAQGNPQAQFVFQIGSMLTTQSASQMLVINGGQSCNVSWQVGSSATLGTASVFVGNILALTSITATTGATVAGRLLARNGAVTLDTNVVTVPACVLPGGATATPVGGPTGVTLRRFTADTEATGQVALRWETAAETDVAGFFVERATWPVQGAASWAPIHVDMIPARGAAAAWTAYRQWDRADPGAYSYRLRVMNSGGAPTYSDPVNVSVRAIRSFLPAAGRNANGVARR